MTRGTLTVVGIFAALFMLTVVHGAPSSATGGQSLATPAPAGGDWTAHLFDGECGGPHAAARFELTPLSPDGMADIGSLTPAVSGTAEAPPRANERQSLISITTVDAPLTNLVAARSAIDVHQPGSPIDASLVCGVVRGTPTDGHLFIRLTPDSGAEYVGSAWLRATPDDRTVIAIALISGQSQCPVRSDATPAAIASPATLVDAQVIADELDVGISLDANYLDLSVTVSSAVFDVDIDLEGEDLALQADVTGNRVCLDLGLTVADYPELGAATPAPAMSPNAPTPVPTR